MKKLMIFFAAMVLSLSAFSGDYYPTKSNVEVNSFWANWFVTVDAGAQVGANQNGFVWNSITPGTALSVGKWITPVVGLRGQLNAGHYSTLAKPDYSVNKQLGGAAFADVMFNLTNIKYGHNRTWNFIPYVGFGRVATQEDYKKNGRWAWNMGLDNQFRVSKHAAVDFEVFANRHNGYGAAGGYNIVPGRNWNVGAFVGLTLNIGKTDWNHPVDAVALAAVYQAKVDAYEDMYEKAMDRLENCLEEKAKVDTIFSTKVLVVGKPLAHSVFFAADSYVPESQKDLRNLQGFVDYLNENKEATVTVYGYADSKTGTGPYNLELSANRAEAVKAYLVEAGADESRVNVVACGGVDELNPYNYNRRAVVVVE